ncbi:hypothetical protein COLO4_08083 [Corchorus olitorius]|uniref:Peptidase C1A papain C-terminal domain-containing protein n=1 Tax=Corchorus olitorius TaxID=93759 RepID=A0A1R3KHE2_9ROSI|nr:hypothetical protein COLO4_08083 [Corchorus olitorius]
MAVKWIQDIQEEPSVKLKIARCEQINGALREKIIRQVHQHPVAAVVDVYSEFILLKEGIYEGPKEYQDDIPTHAVVIVGYGTQGIGPNAKNYWIVMSTWGRGWGVKGFGKVSRDHTIGGKYLVRRISRVL